MAFIFPVLASCGGDDGGGGGEPPPPAGDITVSGRITYERVPFSSTPGNGLDYSRMVALPARAIVVELIDAANQAILRTTTSTTAGDYSFSAPPDTNVFVRAKARSTDPATGGAAGSWDLLVRNNTNGDALYALDSAPFNTGRASQVRDLFAASGWAVFAGEYTGARAAAPFAILDTLYAATQFVLANGVGDEAFPPLGAFWSTANKPFAGDVAAGEIGSTGYVPGTGIYVLGWADGGAASDTDEFDPHVIAHEFQHYLEEQVARADTVGGNHGPGDRLDLRVSFSEGYANAFSAMVLDDPVYRDSLGARQADEFSFDVEGNAWTNPGWFSEGSVQSIAWDLFDAANEAGDAVTTGFGPLYEVFKAELVAGQALTSLFPFVVALKSRPGVNVTDVEALVARQAIVANPMDAFATTEVNFGGSCPSTPPIPAADRCDVLPIYTALPLNAGTPVAVCGNGLAGTYNRIGNRRFLTFSVPDARPVTITVQALPDPAAPAPDPDLVIFRAGVGFFDSSENAGPSETYSGSLPAGDYVLEVYEYDHVDPAGPEPRPRTCMNVTING